MKEISTKKFPRIVSETIKESKILVYSFNNLDKKIKGFSYQKIIGINGSKDFYTKRFTICHELGHNILNHQFGDSKEEKEADNFACNLLIDDYELKEKVIAGWCLSDLEKLFGVPQREIQKRIYQIFDEKDLNFCF
ncbi:hypothetical protein DLH72_01175 [Candidatus Gracilibacteria bacterium]|nr:MAG: hypothetical protein DLH72_01175 [Candidatus Gracilibacteria bacterium]